MNPIEHDGLRFNIRIDGPVGAPWLVFSNSLLTNLSVWDHQVAAFAGRFRILRYDQRGHGGTSVPPGPATITQLCDDIDAIMARLGIAAASLVGLSMGAATGIALAQRHPARVARLVCSDGNASTAPGGAKGWADRIAAARQDGMTALADATLGRWFATPGCPAIPAVRAMIEATPLAGFVACARALQEYDFAPGLPAMRLPALFIAGSADCAMPQTMPLLAAQVPGARYVEVAAAGHLPCIEQPAAFNAALEEFLR